MRKENSRNLGQCRLFVLLLTVSIIVGTESLNLSPSLTASDLPQNLTQPFVRSYKLYSRCSKRFISIRFKRRDVAAKSKRKDPYANLLLESVAHDGKIKIRGEKSKRYLCFNTKGKLILRHYSDSIQCMFQETITPENYNKFQSSANPLWYIGFRRNGKPAKGYLEHRKRKCYEFVKQEDTSKFDIGPAGITEEHFKEIERRIRKLSHRRKKNFRKKSRRKFWRSRT